MTARLSAIVRSVLTRVLVLALSYAAAAHAERAWPTHALGASTERIELAGRMVSAVSPRDIFDVRDGLRLLATKQPGSAQNVPGFGYTHEVAWFAFCTETTEPLDRVMSLRAPMLDEVELFAVEASEPRSVGRAGDRVPARTANAVVREPNFVLRLDGHQCWLGRARGESAITLPVQIEAPDAFQKRQREDTSVVTLYLGLVLSVALYNLLLWASTRTALYGVYAAFVLTFAWTQALMFGVFHEVFGRAGPRWITSTVGTGALSTTAFASVFIVAFLDVESFAPRVARALRIVTGFCSVGALASVVTNDYVVIVRVFLLPGILSGIVLAMSSGIIGFRRGLREARFFLIAWTFVLVGTATTMLALAGVLPLNALTRYGQLVGSSAEVLLLSFALADRIKQLQAEATRNAQLAADNALLAQAATAQVLAEQERANAELQRLDKLKDEFLANTSHELRTPLNGVIGLTEAVMNAEATLSDAGRQRLDLVLKSGRRLSSLVNDILDFSKLQRGEFEVQSARFDLESAVAEVLAMLDPAAATKGLKLRSKVPAGLAVMADAGRVKQILINLIGNALKFTDRGSVRVEAGQVGDRVFVRVVDTGIGIAKDAQERIFVAFEQADGGTARKHGGTGLGLTVTKQLVELHGGTIRVESAEGKGSAFTFDLAAADVDADRESASFAAWQPDEPAVPRPISDAPPARDAYARPSVALALRGAPQGVRLLVADDDPINLEVLRALLEPGGYTLVTANDGREAVARLHDSGPFDAVLLDVMMPKMTGLEAAAQMRADYPHGTLPILMLTAKNRPEDVVAGLQAGADDYLAKPVNGAELLARLSSHIEGLRAMRAVERLLSPELVRLVEGTHAAKLEPGSGVGRSIGVLRVAFWGLETLAARLDEPTLFRKLGEATSLLVTALGDAGAIAEAMGDDQLAFLLPHVDGEVLDAAAAALERAQAKLGDEVRLSAALHAGHVKVGVLGDERWVAVRAVGEASLLGASLARFGAASGFGVLITDAVLGKLDRRVPVRRVGTVRLGATGHPATVYELLAAQQDRVALDDYVDALEAGRFLELGEAVAELTSEDPLVRLLSERATRGDREIVLGGA